jgi:hypothetical protein
METTISLIKIQEILLKIGENEIKLTLQEVRELQALLNKTFDALGNEKVVFTVLYTPVPNYYPSYYYPSYAYWPNSCTVDPPGNRTEKP